MTDKSQEDEEGNLSKLLDDALGDFGKVKTSDEELDDFMSTMDREAAQKAAGKFQQMLQQLAQEQENKQSSSSTPQNSADGEFTKTLNRLSEQTGNVFNSQNDKGFMEALEKLDDKDPMMQDLMGLIMQTALSKDVMYPAVKEVTTNFETYLQTNQDKLEPQLLEQYTKQQKVLVQLCKEYENPSENGSENDDQRASRIAKYWVELQQHGTPPPEIMGSLPAGCMPDSNLLENAQESCVLM
ncbi:pex19 protein family domain-containing protein [Ditylenchus destructor]|uniref:Peroxin-19 n=1 Tax=Ditylenchus destructor TaxID=166010 RepID=A0AAD4NDD7_9BILA|nr:pex19 protein family domain-containing protein [Ditylenchus destructor]